MNRSDVGDLLLRDGAPVRFKEFKGRRVPMFPSRKVLAPNEGNSR